MSGDHRHEGWAADEVAPGVRSQLCCRTDQTCFGCRYTEIKETNWTQDFWIELPFSQAGLCVPVEWR